MAESDKEAAARRSYRWPCSVACRRYCVATYDRCSVEALIGPAGVFVVDVKGWQADPLVVDGRLHAAGEPRDEDVQRLLQATRTVEEASEELGMSPVAVQPLMVFVRKQLDAASL